MLCKNLSFAMAITALVSLLISTVSANVALNGSSFYRQGNTLFAPNANGETVARPIVDMVSVFDDLPASTQVNITGTVEQVMAYINTNFPDYAWPDVEDLDTATSDTATSNFSAVDNTVYCNIGRQGSYYTATMVLNHLRHFGRHILKVGGGPAACAQASCRRRQSATTTPMAFWFCNDDVQAASPTFHDIADLGQIVLKQCVEFGTPVSWIRGQAFHTSLPWNVIVTAQDSCS